jgi:hypothetical protein
MPGPHWQRYRRIGELPLRGVPDKEPFERQDIAIACDRHRASHGHIAEGARFVAVFDQTYGSLRLSGRLMEDGVLREVLENALRDVAAMVEVHVPEHDVFDVVGLELDLAELRRNRIILRPSLGRSLSRGGPTNHRGR